MIGFVSKVSIFHATKGPAPFDTYSSAAVPRCARNPSGFHAPWAELLQMALQLIYLGQFYHMSTTRFVLWKKKNCLDFFIIKNCLEWTAVENTVSTSALYIAAGHATVCAAGGYHAPNIFSCPCSFLPIRPPGLCQMARARNGQAQRMHYVLVIFFYIHLICVHWRHTSL